MTGAEITVVLNSLSRLMLQGQVREAVEMFEFPMPCYLQDRFILFNTSKRFSEMLRTYYQSVTEAGVARMQPTILRFEDRSDYRCLAMVQWDHYRENGTLVATNTVRYVFRQDAQECPVKARLRIELVEFVYFSFKDLAPRLYPETVD